MARFDLWRTEPGDVIVAAVLLRIESLPSRV